MLTEYSFKFGKRMNQHRNQQKQFHAVAVLKPLEN